MNVPSPNASPGGTGRVSAGTKAYLAKPPDAASFLDSLGCCLGGVAAVRP